MTVIVDFGAYIYQVLHSLKSLIGMLGKRVFGLSLANSCLGCDCHHLENHAVTDHHQTAVLQHAGSQRSCF